MNRLKRMLHYRFQSRTAIVAFALLIFVAGVLQAPMLAKADTFTETFLGGIGDGDYFDVSEGWYARFVFNLTMLGETAALYSPSDSVESYRETPTDDETTFIANAYQIEAAELGFTFASADIASEEITIYSSFMDGDENLGTYQFELGNVWTLLSGSYKTAELTINLLDYGLENYLEDGRFITLVIAFESGCLPNDFRIDTASLTVEATPVPIPAGIWLLGAGLLGLSGIRRKLKGRLL
ncbi:VPLPA-CTERM sorting domain-containing protein [uncultured Desulfosarcina sp.]|uniref:VPLPA-CTERM sorting domain-containing protein n=1 Tax=uncultured Desulfosarcina sp. TaxID=218289 RepID=UPI0029C6EB3C|nr:VPLPA-CTERM sorting domain-containing protein [uncultured Desulfosarcina sp.]